MPRRKVHVSSLTAGRCFTLPPEASPAEGEANDDDRRQPVQYGRTMMSPESAWKVSQSGGDTVTAVNAEGAERTFDATTEVVEIPRQGFDRLAARD